MVAATGDIFGSLIRRRLRTQRYNQYLKEVLNGISVVVNYEQSNVVSALRRLETLFDYRDRAVVEDAVYINDATMLNDSQAKNSLFTCMNKVFNDGIITWNRIAVVCTVVCMIADNALRSGKVTRVYQLVCWAEEYFRTKLIDAWILRKNGWKDVVEYAIRRSEPSEDLKVPTKSTKSVSRSRGKTRSPSPYSPRKVANELKELAGDTPSRRSPYQSRPRSVSPLPKATGSPTRLLSPARSIKTTPLPGSDRTGRPSKILQPTENEETPRKSKDVSTEQNKTEKKKSIVPSPERKASKNPSKAEEKKSDDPLSLHGRKLKGMRYCVNTSA